MPSWRYTDEDGDPCAYCVQWTERGRPYWPSGATVRRIFRGIHPRCAENMEFFHAQNQSH
jgi:hypothetical protein